MVEEKLSLIVPCYKLHEELELENDSLRKKSDSLKIALEKFTIGSHSLNMLIDSQSGNFWKNGLGIKEYKKEKTYFRLSARG